MLTKLLALAILNDFGHFDEPIVSRPCKANVKKRFVVDEDEVEKGEPDGIAVRVDRPRMSDYTDFGEFTDDLAKYKSLERAAKACDWPNRDERNIVDDDDFECNCERNEEPLMLEISGEGPGRAVKSNKRLTFEELQRHMQNFDNARKANWW